MKARYLYLYLLAMRDELFAAAHAHVRIGEASTRLHATEDWDRTQPFDDFEEVDAQDDLTAAIETLLSAHARLSLYLFPHPSGGARAATRARVLRELLGVPDDHPLSRREPRNTWMHLDERIDELVWQGDGDFPILRLFDNARIASSSDNDQPILRLVDPGSREIMLLGERYRLDDIFRDVISIESALTKAINKLEEEFNREWPDLSKPPEALEDLLDDRE